VQVQHGVIGDDGHLVVLVADDEFNQEQEIVQTQVEQN
jgi:hypothetical protein